MCCWESGGPQRLIDLPQGHNAARTGKAGAITQASWFSVQLCFHSITCLPRCLLFALHSKQMVALNLSFNWIRHAVFFARMNLPLSNLLPNSKHVDTQLSRKVHESIMATLHIGQLQALSVSLPSQGTDLGHRTQLVFQALRWSMGMAWAWLRPGE